MKYFQIAQAFKNKGIGLFTTGDFKQLTGMSQKSAWAALGRYHQKGLIESPKRGWYYFTDTPPDDYLLANKLFAPSYISFETALAYHSIIPEVVYSIISATTKKTRKFIHKGKAFKYLKIKTNCFTGYFKKETHLIADQEKALVDYLYFVALGKKKLNDRLDLANLNIKKVKKYANLFQKKKLNQLIKKLC